MSLIEVDHNTLNSVADAIDSYCDKQDKEMKDANGAMALMITAFWKGADADAFREKWNGVEDDGSVTKGFKDSLKNYAQCLRACAKEYSNAQEQSYSEARRLPR